MNTKSVSQRWEEYADGRGFYKEHENLNPHIRNETQVAFYDGFAAAMRFMRCELPGIPESEHQQRIKDLEDACEDMAVYAAIHSKPAPVLEIAPIIRQK